MPAAAAWRRGKCTEKRKINKNFATWVNDTLAGVFFTFEDDFVFLRCDENENRGQIATSSLITPMTRFPGVLMTR